MSSIRIKNLPDPTGILYSDNFILSSDDLSYKISLSGIKNEITSPSVNTQSGGNSNYNIQLSDLRNTLVIDKSFDSTITITSGINDSCAVGEKIDVIKMSIGELRVVADSGINIVSQNNLTDIESYHTRCSLQKISSSNWLLSGDLYSAPSGSFSS